MFIGSRHSDTADQNVVAAGRYVDADIAASCIDGSSNQLLVGC